MTQQLLFSDTRRQARDASSRSSAAIAGHIVRLLRGNPEGLTADEIAERLGVSFLSVRPRVSELKRAGFIQDSGKRRKARSGAGTEQAVYVSFDDGDPVPVPERDDRLFDERCFAGAR